tara:strand:+ start:39178 stop:40599 length:1422 start_codon:yes stop_codon:yes gene_type:complete
MSNITYRPASLALRLTLTIGIVAAIVFLTFGWIVNRSIEHHFVQQDAGELAVLSQTIQRALMTTASDDKDKLQQRLSDILAGHEGMYLHLAKQDGKTIFSNAGIDFSAVMASTTPSTQFDENNLHIWKIGEKSYRGAILQVHSNDVMPYTMVVATAIDFHLHYLSGIHHKLWLLILVSLLIMLALVWLAIYQGHAPLRRITCEIRQITTDQLHVRLAPDSVPAELAPLAISFNTMLERIEEMVNRLSNFSADIAHELRTPVTSLMTQTQVALANVRNVDEYREVLYSNLEEYERIAQMIGDMLFLAQRDRNLISANVVALDMATEVRSLFDYFEALADERHIVLHLEGEASLHGDRQMLRRALSNLLSNAIRYTPDGESIYIKLGMSSDQRLVNITVENPGQAIPSELIPKIFDRFYRADKSRTRYGDGAGLGLAIVKSIIEAHSGHITALSQDGRTFFKVVLPIGSIPRVTV